ncbi:hypothetical protein B0A55_04960 [Friedmanniomyces simplex]|uniref:Uncharacterized protein n=1 Tax=Friedmanniomyces simplex TaxID=329884 RepID=A0A4U0XPT7_9PEZI|nr:hypothetical protein B0A55_04960 [Friedmanniomyces simplex]
MPGAPIDDRPHRSQHLRGNFRARRQLLKRRHPLQRPRSADPLNLLHCYFSPHCPSVADQIVLSLKSASDAAAGLTGSPEAVLASIDEALRVLKGVKTLNIFESVRVDPNVVIEVSVQALADLVVKEGKIEAPSAPSTIAQRTDFRFLTPCLAPQAFEQSSRLVAAVERLAERKGVTTARMTIAWEMRQVRGAGSGVDEVGAGGAEL